MRPVPYIRIKMKALIFNSVSKLYKYHILTVVIRVVKHMRPLNSNALFTFLQMLPENEMSITFEHVYHNSN
jgi:hypothetical protein